MNRFYKVTKKQYMDTAGHVDEDEYANIKLPIGGQPFLRAMTPIGV